MKEAIKLLRVASTRLELDDCPRSKALIAEYTTAIEILEEQQALFNLTREIEIHMHFQNAETCANRNQCFRLVGCVFSKTGGNFERCKFEKDKILKCYQHLARGKK